MDRSREIFLQLASAAKKVTSGANDYARRQNKCGVQRAHFQLEDEMRKITVACECIADLLGKSTSLHGPACDVRLRDWLDTDEPQECLDTLLRIEKMLQTDASWVSRLFHKGRTTTAPEDEIKEAVKYFSSRKTYFHFLFSTDIWNNEKGVPQQPNPVVQPDLDAIEHALFIATQMQINSPVPHLTDLQDGHANHTIQRELGSINQSAHVYLQANLQTIANTVPEDDYIVNQRRQEAVSSGQRTATKLARLKQEIVKWLDGWNCAEKHDDTLSLRQPDTCKWLFDTAEYKLWRDSDNAFLWLRGKPGAGKSVLASSVIDSLGRSPREGEILTFFYCDFRSERSSSPAEVLRSILSQLLRSSSTPNIGSLLEDLVKTKERGGSARKNPKDLSGYICRVAALSSKKPLVIIDALDECKDVGIFLEALKAIKDHVRLFVTSRPLHVIMEDLYGLPFISTDDMDDEVVADIQLHVTRELDARHRLRSLPAEFKMEIRSALCAGACGMFRWIQCSLHALERCVNRTEVRRALNSLPEGLDETYERILRGVDKAGGEGQLARRALTWLVAALRPLSLTELVEGLSIDLRTRTLDSNFGPMHSGALLDVCGSLVTFFEKTDIITLSHFSVKEYLVGKLILMKLPRYHIDMERAHLQLAQSCMCYLSMHLDSSSRSRKSSTFSASNVGVVSSMGYLHIVSEPLRNYALDHAIDHFRYLGSQFRFVLHDIQVLANRIRQHSRAWDNLCRSGTWDVFPTAPTWPPSKHDLTLYMIVAYAQNSFLEAWLRRTILESKEGTNPLIYAAYFNREEHARTLLTRGTRLNRRGWDINGFFQVLPIEVALENRHYDVVTLFIEEGSSVPSHTFADPFFWAHRSYIPPSVAKMLLQTDDFVEAANDPLNDVISSPEVVFDSLSITANYEHDLTAILQRFILAVDNDLTHDIQGERLLRFAVVRGYFSLARYLLSHGVSLPSNMLAVYGQWGNQTTMDAINFLVENGANVHAHTPDGDPVLCIALRSFVPSWAAMDLEGPALETVKVLVGHGCDPFEANFTGETPLHIAVRSGFISVTRYLLSLDLSPSPDLLQVALKCLVQQKRKSMIICLLENGADVHAGTPDGDPLLHSTLQLLRDEEAGNKDHALETVKVLIDYGCDPLEAGSSGKTLLHIAVEYGFVAVTRYLLSSGISSSLAGNLLPLALTLDDREKVPMIGCLVENGADVHTRTATGEPVLHAVLWSAWDDQGALETVKTLIDRGCDPFEANPSGETLLHIAVKFGFVSVTQYLLSLGIPLSVDLLPLATMFDEEEEKVPMPGGLVENGANADVGTCSATGEPILHTALSSSRDDEDALETVKALVGCGCDPFEASPSRETPLLIAIKCGFVSVVRYLLTLGCSPSCDLLHVALRISSEQKRAAMIICLVENHNSIEDLIPLYTVLQSFRAGYDALEIVKSLISHGFDPLAASSSGETSLHIAAERGFVSVAQYLLSHGMAPSPHLLNLALTTEDKEKRVSMIVCLLDNGADVHARTPAGDPVPHAALESFPSEYDALETVKAFIGYGFDPFTASSSGETLLHLAVRRAFVSVAQYLLSLGIPLSAHMLHVVLESTSWTKTAMIIYLIKNGADVQACTAAGESVLYAALQSSSWDDARALEDIKFLIDQGCDPFVTTPSGETLLHIAVERGFISVTRYLLSLGISPSPDLLHIAMKIFDELRQRSIIVCLLENGVDVQARPSAAEGPILHAVLQLSWNEEHAFDITAILVCHGCDPHEVDSSGKTLFHTAVERGFVSVVQYLLSLGVASSPDLLFVALRLRRQLRKKMFYFLLQASDQGASVLARSQNGDSLLHAAIVSFNDDEVVEVVEVLLRRGCDPTIPNDSGATPFHIAVEQECVPVIKFFLSENVQPPLDILFTAIESSYELSPEVRLEMVAILITSGCDVQTRNTIGQTPLEAAISRGHMDVVDYLMSLASSGGEEGRTLQHMMYSW